MKRNRKRSKKRTVIALIIVAAFIAAGIFVLMQVKKKNLLLNLLFVSGTDTVGVDISNHQGDVDMEMLAKQGVAFVYMKATEGSGFEDPEFEKNWENAEKAGIPSGAYHFFSFDSEGEDQAENFIEVVGGIKGRLIPVVDVEFYGEHRDTPPSREDVVRELKDYLAALEDEYEVKPMIYMSPEIYKKYIEGDFDAYPKWISSVFHPPGLTYKGDWILWQYTDRGRLDGTNGREEYIDLNVLNRKAALDALFVE